MTTSTAHRTMTSDEIVALSKRHSIFEWSAQNAIDPIPVAAPEPQLKVAIPLTVPAARTGP